MKSRIKGLCSLLCIEKKYNKERARAVFNDMMKNAAKHIQRIHEDSKKSSKSLKDRLQRGRNDTLKERK